MSSASPSSWSPPTADELQTQLPAYHIECFLARGGMGAVYRGVQLSLDRPVAIKVLPASVYELDPSFADRFQQEARAMARLNHPGIVGIYDFGQMADGALFLVMEFVAGTDVAAMIASKGRLSSSEAMAITAHVCDALRYAHGEGIVHRDIKPANIMVSVKGEVKVADFGLAKIASADVSGLTRSGTVMGTLHFMAPEALTMGAVVDHRADIYAVGVMLYQMLTGKLPQGMFELPSKQVPGLDPRFDGIVSEALRERVEDRYQDAGRMRLALDALLTQPVPVQTPSPPRAAPRQAAPPPRRAVAPASGGKGWMVALAAVLALGGAWMVLKKPSSPRASEMVPVTVVAPSATATPAPPPVTPGLPEESLDGIPPGPWAELNPIWHAMGTLVRDRDGSGFLPNDVKRLSRFRPRSVEFVQKQPAPMKTSITPGGLLTINGAFEASATISHTGGAQRWTMLVPIGRLYLVVDTDLQRGEVTASPPLNCKTTAVPALKSAGPHRLTLRLTSAKDGSARSVLKVLIDDVEALHWAGTEADLPEADRGNLTRMSHSVPVEVAMDDAGSILVEQLRFRSLGGTMSLRPLPGAPVVAARPQAPPTAPATTPPTPATKPDDGPPWLDAIAAFNTLPGLKRDAEGLASFASDTQRMLRFSDKHILIEHRQAAIGKTKTPLLAPPVTIDGPFELEAKIVTSPGAGYCTLHVPVGSRHLPLGISFERGEIVTDPKLRATSSPNSRMKTPGEHGVQLRLDAKGLSVSIDGTQALGWTGTDADLPASSIAPQSMPLEFGFASSGTMEVTQLRLRGSVKLGAPTPAPKSPPPVAKGQAPAPKPAAPAPRPPFIVEGEWQDFIAAFYSTPTLEREKDGSAYLPNTARVGRFRADMFEITCAQGVGITPYLMGAATISGAFECQARLRITGDAEAWHVRVPVGQRYVLVKVDFARSDASAEPKLKSKPNRNRKSKRLGEHVVNISVIPEAEGSETQVLKVMLDDAEVLTWSGKESDLDNLPVKIGWADVNRAGILPMGFGFEGPGQFQFTQLQLRSLGGTVTLVKY